LRTVDHRYFSKPPTKEDWMSKQQYRVRNWNEYNKSLVSRGSITVWFEPDSLSKWLYSGKQNKGGVKKYSDFAIEVALTIKEVYKLTYRAAQGFIESLLSILQIKNTAAPNYTTLCRRAKTLNINISKMAKNNRNVCVLIDSTGLRVVGESEWYHSKYYNKTKKRQTWRKLHIAIDHNTLHVLNAVTTESHVHDATHFPSVISGIDPSINIDTVIGDGSYSLHTCHVHADKKGVSLIAPPHTNSNTHSENRNYKNKPPTPQRDKAINFVRKFQSFEQGLKKWKLANNYYRRSLVENTMFRLKSVFGDKIKCKTMQVQQTILAIRCLALNKMTDLGMPNSYPIN